MPLVSLVWLRLRCAAPSARLKFLHRNSPFSSAGFVGFAGSLTGSPFSPQITRMNYEKLHSGSPLTRLSATCSRFIGVCYWLLPSARSLHHSITLPRQNAVAAGHSDTPPLHHSTTPSLHHSITPILHHSDTPTLRHAADPLDIARDSTSCSHPSTPRSSTCLGLSRPVSAYLGLSRPISTENEFSKSARFLLSG